MCGVGLCAVHTYWMHDQHLLSCEVIDRCYYQSLLSPVLRGMLWCPMHAVVVRVIFMLCVSLWAEAARWMWLAGRLYEHVKGCGLCALSAHYWPTVGAHHNGCPIRCPAVLVPPAHINTLSCSTGVVVVVVCLCQHSCSAGCGCVGVLLVCP